MNDRREHRAVAFATYLGIVLGGLIIVGAAYFGSNFSNDQKATPKATSTPPTGPETTGFAKEH